MDTVKRMFNFQLLIEPLFLLFAICGFVNILGFFIPLFFLPDMAMENGGLKKQDANFLLSIYGKYDKIKVTDRRSFAFIYNLSVYGANFNLLKFVAKRA